MPGNIPSVWQISTHWINITNFQSKYYYYTHFKDQKKKPRPTEVNQVAENNITRKWQIQDLNTNRMGEVFVTLGQ